jgi:hypothetical protein
MFNHGHWMTVFRNISASRIEFLLTAVGFFYSTDSHRPFLILPTAVGRLEKFLASLKMAVSGQFRPCSREDANMIEKSDSSTS